MRKLFNLFAVVTLLFFASCEDESTTIVPESEVAEESIVSQEDKSSGENAKVGGCTIPKLYPIFQYWSGPVDPMYINGNPKGLQENSAWVSQGFYTDNYGTPYTQGVDFVQNRTSVPVNLTLVGFVNQYGNSVSINSYNVELNTQVVHNGYTTNYSQTTSWYGSVGEKKSYTVAIGGSSACVAYNTWGEVYGWDHSTFKIVNKGCLYQNITPPAGIKYYAKIKIDQGFSGAPYAPVHYVYLRLDPA